MQRASYPEAPSSHTAVTLGHSIEDVRSQLLARESIPASQRPTTTSGYMDGTGAMQIFIKTVAGRTIAVDVHPRDTVAQLKALIFEREGLPPDSMYLVTSGKAMEDARMLSEYNIQRYCTVFVLMRLRDGRV